MPIVWAKSVDLRAAWGNEEKHFTPWLAEQENLSKLGEILGLNQLELVKTEYPVGRFFVDIFCTDDEGEVIIENQLEKTDHTHLGQIITYAAGVKAKKIIWVAKNIQEEHAAAIEFLNENTGEELNFFAVEIGVSLVNGNYIPNFNVIVRPNNWAKESRENTRAAIRSSPLSQLQLKYWSLFNNYLDENNIDLRRPRPQGRSWAPISLGKTGFQICLKVNTIAKWIAVELYIDRDDAEEMFDRLKKDENIINQEIGNTLDWQDLPNRTACRIEITRQNSDLWDENNWLEYMEWHSKMAIKFYQSFRQRVLEL